MTNDAARASPAGAHLARTPPAPAQAVATAVRVRLQLLLRMAYWPLYAHRGVRVSLPRQLCARVEGVLCTLDREAPQGARVLAEDLPALVEGILLPWTAYVRKMYPREWEALRWEGQATLLGTVEVILCEEMGALCRSTIRPASRHRPPNACDMVRG